MLSCNTLFQEGYCKFMRHLASISTLATTLMFVPARVLAATQAGCTTSVGGFLNFPTWYKYLNPTFAGGECNLSFNLTEDLPKVLLAVFEIILRVGGMIAVVMVIFGGFQFMLSQGNPEQTKGARSTIINALIGLAISISAVAIVNLIGKNL